MTEAQRNFLTELHKSPGEVFPEFNGLVMSKCFTSGWARYECQGDKTLKNATWWLTEDGETALKMNAGN